MISLDQVLLLEEKVESAVAKIQQLEAENDALRNKCSELTNALSAKSEQLKAYESEQNKIESGIIKAIDRLNSIENSVLKGAGQPEPKQAAPSGLAATAATLVTDKSFEQMTPVEPEEPPFEEEIIEEPDAVEQAFEETSVEEPIEETIDETIEEPVVEDDADDAESDPESKDQLGFDIF